PAAGGRPSPLPLALRLQGRCRGQQDAAEAGVPPAALAEAGGQRPELAPEPALEVAPPAPLAPTPPTSPPASPKLLARALTLVDRSPLHQRAEPWDEAGRLYRL
ncbi:unnamed protein product, partial [Prorocentrum cordatum]